MMTDVEPAVLQDAFRQAMSSVCSPVSVVTGFEDDLPYGTTVSAFASLSLEPPMVLISLDKRSNLLGLVRRTRRFGLNVLASGQAELALNFARKGGPAKFLSVPWGIESEVPRLPGAAGFLACQVANLIEGGDHMVVFGTVLSAETTAGQPLTYHGRKFGTHCSVPACTG
jgi:flavin reductase (DIM6/NTAB) family NADH-FMN oxidoreductase RutF